MISYGSLVTAKMNYVCTQTSNGIISYFSVKKGDLLLYIAVDIVADGQDLVFLSKRGVIFMPFFGNAIYDDAKFTICKGT